MTDVRRYSSTDPDALAKHMAEENDALASMIGGMADRIDAHDKAIGRNGDELKRMVADGVADGLSRAVGDPQFWMSARAAMLNQATAVAGGWVIEGFFKILRMAFWVAVVGVGLYLLGGWKLLATALAAQQAKGP